MLNLGGSWNADPRSVRYNTVNFDREYAEYGVYDFLIEGFPLVRQSFRNSVYAIIVRTNDGGRDIGSGFLLNYEGDEFVVTARHCVLDHDGFQIRTENGQILTPIEIWITCNSCDDSVKSAHIDIAVIKVGPTGHSPFQLDAGKILDHVLTMGFPPIPGFDAVQFSETAIIAGLMSTTGEITGEGFSHVGKQNLFLISARVKGGNSGGPVINKSGKVVGVITDFPVQDGKMDTMGYGVVTPTETLIDVLLSLKRTSQAVMLSNHRISNDDKKWSTFL